MIEKRIIGAFFLLILLPTIFLGCFAYFFSLNEVKKERINTVGQVANTKHELLKSTLQNQRASLQALAHHLITQCDMANASFQRCITTWSSLYLESEGASGLLIQDTASGAKYSVGSPQNQHSSFDFKPGQLAKFSDSENAEQRTYSITAHNELFNASITYPATSLNPLFHAPSELGEAGETFLADGKGYFITPPKHQATQGYSAPISASPMRVCLNGNNKNTLDKDYRNADIIHGFKFIPEIGSGCIMAHAEQREAFAVLDILRLKIIIVTLTTASLGALIAFFISKQIATPISNLTELSRRIQQGDYTAKAEVKGHDEISELANSFNQLTSKLVTINLELEQKIKERTSDLEWNEHKLDTILNNVREGIISINEDGSIETFNHSAELIFGYDANELIGKNVSILMHDDTASQHDKHLKSYMETGIKHIIGFSRELNACHKDGSNIEIILTVSEARFKDRRVFVGSISDIRLRKQNERQLRMLAAAFELSGEAMIICDKDFKATYANDAFSHLTGFNKERLLGKYTGLDQHTVSIDGESMLLTDALGSNDFLKGEIHKQNSQSRTMILWFNLSVLRDQDSQVNHYVISFSDISDRKEEEDRIRHLARHDSLTGLINRSTLFSQLEHSCILAQRHNSKLAVLFIDLDGFKAINDGLSHAVGDRVLIEIADKLKRHSRKSDIACRLGGDEFVLVITGLQEIEQIRPLTSILCKALQTEVTQNNKHYEVSASIGVSIFPSDATTAEELINKADLAMYYSKTHGKNSVSFYDQKNKI